MKVIFRKRLLLRSGIAFLILLTLSTGFVLNHTVAQALQTANSLNTGISTVDPEAFFPFNAGRQVLPTNDGWASAEGGTTGGADATKEHVYTVTNREELVQALGGDNTGADATPKIIFIKGIINGNEDDAGNALSCDDYVSDGYSLAAYLSTYDPAVWGRTSVPSGPLEAARKASQVKQAGRVVISIPSNTTIIGSGNGARVIGANFMVKGVNNVIIRNIQFENASDCFPQWDPTDGSTGNWNSQYDNMSVIGSTHVWVDHNSFTDANQPDSLEPLYFDRPFQQHDGELDITKAADLVTVSWNRFADHDKTMLIGSTDSPTFDVGKLRVTVHHNEFRNTIQRLPRVRYGQVHVYNNFYNQATNSDLLYALGVGVASQTFAQNNYYALPAGFAPAKVIGLFKGTAIHTEGDLVNGEPVDILAAYNLANDPDLSGDVGWTPQFHLHIDPAKFVPDLVRHFAGASSILKVASNGKGDFSTVQAAIDAIPVNNAANVTISLKAGTYREVVNVPSSKPYITLVGGTLRPEDTVITFDNWSGSPAPGGGTLGTSGSATATLNASDFTARFLTFANTFDPASHPETNQHQAVAVKTSGDRMVFEFVRFLGNQDTLYVNSPSTTSQARQLCTNCYVEGTIDFIFGRGTAVFDKSVIFIKNTTGTGPKMTAAATPAAQVYGYLFTRSIIKSSAPAGSSFLGRPWPATADAQAQVTVRDTWLPGAIASAPWQDWTSPPVPWQSARYAEFHNFGPGATVNTNRPQLTPQQAALQTPF
ncbi:MAG TPA: pectinesterase family protein, partial [Ktedonobacteraceae bacterium]|nr:pectinesterase family protein [Ktedonobacteraceae bacterium]